ncbi:hypothetical protein RI367_002236 [Sorochytrium milnesiophthora]
MSAREAVTNPLEQQLQQTPGGLLETAQEFLIDNGLYTDSLLRQGVRLLLRKRLADLHREYKTHDIEQMVQIKRKFVEELKKVPKLAVHTDKANEQHYEVDTEFFRLCLGKHLKYSSCLFNSGVTSLDQAEADMLSLYCERAQLKDGMKILDMGCGWGSLSLFLATKYPKSQVTGVSNSSTQREYITNEIQRRGLTNLKIITADINEWSTAERFHRILSIEMFEHLKNYSSLFAKLASVLAPTTPAFGPSLLFIHIFAHRELPYHFQTSDDNSWMARYFFSGGTMPSLDLFTYCQQELELVNQWAVNGTHYGKTSRAWLRRMDNAKKECLVWLAKCYGESEKHRWFHRWRVFYIAVEELFNYNNGQEWVVGHYLFQRKGA